MQSSNGFLGKLKAKLGKLTIPGSQSSDSPNGPSGTAVLVNVYDMFWLNNYVNPLGIGVYHTGVVVYETEYGYGGHPLSYSGIFAMAPRDTETLGPNYIYKTTIEMGYTDFTEADIALILEDMGPEYRGDQYHLLQRNCNHFSNAFVQILCGASLPKWINRLAGVGAKLPFVERSIPRMWLTPRPFTEDELFQLTSFGEIRQDPTDETPNRRTSWHRLSWPKRSNGIIGSSPRDLSAFSFTRRSRPTCSHHTAPTTDPQVSSTPALSSIMDSNGVSLAHLSLHSTPEEVDDPERNAAEANHSRSAAQSARPSLKHGRSMESRRSLR